MTWSLNKLFAANKLMPDTTKLRHSFAASTGAPMNALMTAICSA